MDPVNPSYKRLFLGIALPDYLLAALRKLKSEIPGFHWLKAENMHLTLRFIGAVENELEEKISAVLAAIAVGSFFLPVKGIGAFPKRGRPQTVWVGLENGHPRLFQLQGKIENNLLNLGMEAGRRAYHPHLTLARTGRAKPGAVRQFLKDHRDFEAPPFKAEHFNLYSSRLSPEGAVHTVERRFELNRSSPGEAESQPK